MKVIILTGGLGLRLSERADAVPKPLIEIGRKPILHHIMSHYSKYGHNEFIIALGYKKEPIKKYFIDYMYMNNDISIDFSASEISVKENSMKKWVVHLVDTGEHTHTGGRIKRLKNWLDKDEPFMVTYCDGISDINLDSLVKFHKSHGRLATISAVKAPDRFGVLKTNGDDVVSFNEKPINGSWINAGFFVLDYGVLDYIDSDDTVFEKNPLEKLSQERQLQAYKHNGFWQCMDTLKEKDRINELYNNGFSPWEDRRD